MTGTFVYRGAGKKQNKDADLSQTMCKKEACQIQWCLARSNHQETRCNGYIEAWKDCVIKAKEIERIRKEELLTTLGNSKGDGGGKT